MDTQINRARGEKYQIMTYSLERETAIKAVEMACHLCISVQGRLVSEETMAKKDKSPVTVADFGAQAVVVHALRSAFGHDPVVGEEDAGELRSQESAELRRRVVQSVQEVETGLDERMILDAIDRGNFAGGPRGRHWTLDPIDGTKGFLRHEQYAVALALIEDGQVVLGVLGCPNLPHNAHEPQGPTGCLFVAQKGHGAFMRHLDHAAADLAGENRIHVTKITDPSKATFCESVESAHSAQDDSAKIAQLLGISAPPYRIDSQCKYAAVSRGDASIYLRLPTKKGYEEKIWDHAAGVAVLTEAGGRASDVYGRELDFSIGRTLKNNTGVVVTNGLMHEAVVRAVGQTLNI